MELSISFLKELQNRLKVGNRLSTHLNAIPKKSNYKLDFSLLSAIDQNLPEEFLETLFTKPKFSFEISWRDKEIDLFNLSTGEQKKFTTISKIFTNLFNQVKEKKEERGVETFGFGFPLLIRKDRADKKLTVAPLIIWKLNLQRSMKNDSWIISKEVDSSIYLNEVLINHLQADSGIILDQLSSDLLDDSILSKEELFDVCKEVLIKTNLTKIANLDQSLSQIFTEIQPIGTEEEYNELPLNDTNSILNFSGLFSYFEIQKQSIIKDYDELLELQETSISQDELADNVFQSFTSVQTDPSQQEFLNSIERTRNLVIQGPPGTGKSQTLTALLINALENGKKTIVVCEKHTALDILHKSLEKIGLSSHTALINDASANRQKIVSEARSKVGNLPKLSLLNVNGPFKYSSQLRNIKNVIAEINKQHESLDRELLAKYKWSDITGKFLKNHRFNQNQKTSFRTDISFQFTYDEYDEWCSLLQKGQELFHKYLGTGQNDLLNNQAFLNTSFIKFEEELNDSVQDYEMRLINLKDLKNKIYEQFVLDRNKDLFEQKEKIEELIKNLRSLNFNLAKNIQSHKDNFITIEKSDFDNEISRFSGYVTKLNSIWSRNQGNPDFINEERHSSLGFKLGSWFSEEKRRVLQDVKEFRELYDILAATLVNSSRFSRIDIFKDFKTSVHNFINFNKVYNSTISDFTRNAENNFNSLDLPYLVNLKDSTSILEHIQLLQQRHFLSENQKNVLDNLSLDVNNFFSNLYLRWVELDEALKSSPDFTFVFSFDPSQLNIEFSVNKVEKRISSVVESFKTKVEFEYLNSDILKSSELFSNLPAYEELKSTLTSFSQKIISDNLFLNFNPPVNLNAYIDYTENFLKRHAEKVLNNPEFLANSYKWINYYENLDIKKKEIISELKSENNWEYSFLTFYFDKLLKLKSSDDLPTDEALLNEYIKKIEHLQSSQISNINDFWYKKQKDAVALFNKKSPQFQVTNLFNLRGAAGNRRYSLRNIIEYNCDLFTDLHPIILTTPDVASTLFRNKNGYFDFVVFDEASQLRLEDNLPAMLKGKQIVIAGDEHQMPPSSFFEKKLIAGLLDSEEDDEQEDYYAKDKSSVEAALLSSISLLDAVSELNFSNKHLNFHYRSKHPYLIDFSNYAFYAQRLIPLPITSDYTPISYINVGGIYDSNVNEKEAEVVISILKNNIHRDSKGSYPSVGIATFNIKQRDFIKNKILELKKIDKDKEFIKKIEELESNGMFIKNLENIQGDERDVIIMSTTYGRSPANKFEQRFGQLNNSKGYKLLNVIVTRAKYKNYVVTSIPEERISDYRSYLVTAGTNHSKAPLYAYLAYSKAVSEKNEDARNKVLQALAFNNPVSVESASTINAKLESVFEEEVYHRLVETNLKDFIQLQYQVGGFRIDMVIDFQIPGIPKIALECDGAKYHSSDEAYLYDYHRQKILESHGFKFHRIWSTNWWRNPDYEVQKLIEFVESIKAPKPGNLFENNSGSIDIFADEIIFENNEGESGIEIEVPSEGNIENLFPEEEVIIADESMQKIDIGSMVKIKYINKNEILQFKIVSPQIASNEQNPSVREVLFNRPLGKAIMGKSVGDSASIEGVDNIVEILEIL